jgi:phytoene dehydrogenase-like protein
LFAGIFLEPDLATSSRVFDFVFRMMAMGPVALPAGGMAALPAQLALSLPSTSLKLETPVAAVSTRCVHLASGLSINASAVVVAADAPALTGLAPRQWLPTMQVAFAADRAPFSRPILGLDGDGSGPVNHLAVPSLVAPGYAPTGRHLISANVVGARARENEKTLLPAIMQQMHAWFGPDAASWHVLAIHRIEKALPVQLPGALEPIDRAISREDGVYLAGEQRHMASLQGALRAGRRVAEAVLGKY